MIFTETTLKGAFIVETQKIEDERGFFARTWCRREFSAAGIDAAFVQCNLSQNRKSGTLRGLHYQADPFGEAKLVSCIRGALYDVIVDLRPRSGTFGQWTSVDLSAGNRRMVFIPEGFAHGFLTLEDDTEVFYQMSQYYMPEYARGIRWDDPALNIRWPREIDIVSDRDGSYPDFGLSRGADGAVSNQVWDGRPGRR